MGVSQGPLHDDFFMHPIVQPNGCLNEKFQIALTVESLKYLDGKASKTHNAYLTELTKQNMLLDLALFLEFIK